jgi:hypothetical protein
MQNRKPEGSNSSPHGSGVAASYNFAPCVHSDCLGLSHATEQPSNLNARVCIDEYRCADCGPSPRVARFRTDPRHGNSLRSLERNIQQSREFIRFASAHTNRGIARFSNATDFLQRLSTFLTESAGCHSAPEVTVSRVRGRSTMETAGEGRLSTTADDSRREHKHGKEGNQQYQACNSPTTSKVLRGWVLPGPRRRSLVLH